MFYLLKGLICLFTATSVGSSLHATVSCPVAAAQSASSSNTHEDDQALDQGEATDEDVIIMEEDEDSEQYQGNGS